MTSPNTSTLPAVLSEALTDLNLNDEWRLGGLLPVQNSNHASVYSILVIETGQIEKGLEAHAFSLDPSIPPQVRKHRLRCVKRMGSRTKLEHRVEDVLIVVISTSQLDNNSKADSSSMIPHTELKSRPKTEHQRESARLRQRQRKKEKQKEKKQLQSSELTTGETLSAGPSEPYLDDTNSESTTTLTLLWVLYDESDQTKEMPPVHKSFVKSSQFSFPLDKYIEGTNVDLDTIDAMESYLSVRRQELLSLKRQEAYVPSSERYHRNSWHKYFAGRRSIQQTMAPEHRSRSEPRLNKLCFS